MFVHVSYHSHCCHSIPALATSGTWPQRQRSRSHQASTLPILNIRIPAFFNFFPAEIAG
jgi:hypothetical protein